MRLLLVLFLATFGCASTRSVAQVKPVDFFLDPAGKAYLLLSDSRLITQNQLGQTVNDFYDSSLGFPDNVDVTNPFSILLYYQDFGRLVILDRTLSEITRIDLFSVDNIQQPGVLARANDNQVWVYDSWDHRLKLLDNQGRVERTTNDLRLELSAPEDPDAIFVDRGTVALYFREKSRLAVLTNYGRFKYWVDLPVTANVSWLTPYLTGYDEETSWRWVPGLRTVKEWAPRLSSGQVPGLGEGKRLAVRDGYHLLEATGKVGYRAVD
ncbi:hypothetical protein [Neolewinella antarctica]|uniref:Uncharacterized protein n=1 Tax=Neolewinella antarctica TaxID=442734 RepID=A0ABX0XGG1_9BACT|nr:hypothetical protein [Neolewinella antarctica]NJC27959.1 hypothetical protein [Neolewinella antarctica]